MWKDAGLTGSPTERFDLYLQNAEKGQTLREVMNEYIKDTGASQTEKNNILFINIDKKVFLKLIFSFLLFIVCLFLK